MIFAESFLLRDLPCRRPLLTLLAEDAVYNVLVKLLCLLGRPESFAVEMLLYVGEGLALAAELIVAIRRCGV